jgi:hypothetical protein
LKKNQTVFVCVSGVAFYPNMALSFSPGPWSNDKVVVWDISGKPVECYFTQPPACSWGDLLFCHSFLIVPETPEPLLRMRYLKAKSYDRFSESN